MGGAGPVWPGQAAPGATSGGAAPLETTSVEQTLGHPYTNSLECRHPLSFAYPWEVFCLCCPKGWLAQCPLLAVAQSCPLEWQGMGCRSFFPCRPARHPMGPAPGSLLLVQPLRD